MCLDRSEVDARADQEVAPSVYQSVNDINIIKLTNNNIVIKYNIQFRQITISLQKYLHRGQMLL